MSRTASFSSAAEVAVQRLGDGLLEIGARDRRLRQALEQDLAIVEKAGRAIAALKGEVADTSPTCIVPAASFDGKSIRTVEGHAKDGELSPLQKAFISSSRRRYRQ
jgi:hypothetical protein